MESLSKTLTATMEIALFGEEKRTWWNIEAVCFDHKEVS
jgi:hypothetical protein